MSNNNTTKRVLMVKPDHFDVTYSINPWMNTSVGVNRKSAIQQWESVLRELQSTGIDVTVIDSKQGLNDMVFAANAGMVHNGRAIVSKFRDRERAGEEPFFKEWFLSAGFETFELKSPSIWEGQACSVFIDDFLVCSYSFGGRSNHEAYADITSIWNVDAEKQKYIKLIDPYFYHLDVCLCKMSDHTSMLCPLAFSQADNKWFSEHIPNIISISYDEALSFGCNAFTYDNHIFLSSAISHELRESLEDSGLIVHPLDMSEYIKSGGGVKCLILEY